jgi:hypothetical protein
MMGWENEEQATVVSLLVLFRFQREATVKRKKIKNPEEPSS